MPRPIPVVPASPATPVARTRSRTPVPVAAAVAPVAVVDVSEFVEPEEPEDDVMPDAGTPVEEIAKKDKKKTEIETLHGDINKRCGPGVIRSALTVPVFPNIATGAFTLDFALMGGIPEMLMSLLFGNENSGKTTIMNRIIASAQRKHPDKKALVVDFENTYDVQWAAFHGVDLSRLDLAQPDTGEDGADIIVGALETWEYCIVAHDSIAMSTPHKIIKDSAGDVNVAPLARLMGILASKATRSLNTQRRRRHVVSYVATNQFRMQAGGMVFGDPRTLPGGKPINNYVPMTKLELKSKEIAGEDALGTGVVDHTDHSFIVKKCKTGMSIRQGEFQMAVSPDHPQGFGTILDAPTVALFGMRFGFITGKPKAWYMRDVDAPFSGKEAIYDFLYKEPGEMLRLQQRIISAQRVSKGLPALPPDGFLLDWNAKDNLEL